MSDAQQNGMGMEPMMDQDTAKAYVKGLESGSVQLSADATEMEKQVLQHFKEASNLLREIDSADKQSAKQMENLKQRREQIQRDLIATNAELNTYARLLLGAQDARMRSSQTPPQAPQQPEGKGNGVDIPDKPGTNVVELKPLAPTE
jgi:DNA repair exonuclease SbcCD ATPase subunit